MQGQCRPFQGPAALVDPMLDPGPRGTPHADRAVSFWSRSTVDRAALSDVVSCEIAFATAFLWGCAAGHLPVPGSRRVTGKHPRPSSALQSGLGRPQLDGVPLPGGHWEKPWTG